MMDFRTIAIALALLGVIGWSVRLPAPDSPDFHAALLAPDVSSENVEPPGETSANPIVPVPSSALPRSARRPEAVRREGVADIMFDARSAFAVTDTGFELFAKDADAPLPIASISKLMTAIVALGKLPLDAEVTVTPDAIRAEGDTAGLVAGERLSLHDALLAMLVPSSNDAAVAIAEATGGVPLFVAAMNETAQAIGMVHARFANPHGLAPPGNGASARDVAILLREALAQPALFKMLRQERAEIVSVEGFVREFRATNILLSRVPGSIGGKTGFTEESRGTLAFAFSPRAALDGRAAEAGDGYVIVVVLGSHDRFADTEALARWLLAAYAWE